uniref:Uncharacterized protein n=1 Tax=Meloidogyne enterolobii TaxID=390850 RepID=A0A6V7YD16_MELEN|nr:unnamed protein product [Meloidogyne enterolobii]
MEWLHFLREPWKSKKTNHKLFTNHSGACEVTFEGNFIVLHYKKESIAARNGCKVDLLTNLQNMIYFTTEVKHSDVIEKCLGKCKGSNFFDGSSDNLLPFAYSTTEDKNIMELTNGPIYKENVTCSDEWECQNSGGRCMPWTSLEVAWTKCKNNILAHTHPIGEVRALWRRHKMYDQNETELFFNLNITKDGNFIMDFDGKQMMNYFESENHAVCIPEGKGIAEPVTWEINGTLPNSNYANLLVFHMLPQKASRKYNDGQIKKDDLPDGPKCDELSIKFHMDNYILLTNEDFIAPLTTTTATTTKLPEPTKSDDREIPFGFFNHTLKGEMVTLAERVGEVNKDNLSLYTKHPGACEVTLEDNFIVLHYKKESKAAKNGCTVDLLSRLHNMIKLETGVENKGGIEKCLGKCSSEDLPFNGSSANLLPFGYSTTRDKNITKLKVNGPLYDAKEENCHNQEECGKSAECMRWTSLEAAWTSCNNKSFAHAHPMGEVLAVWSTSTKFDAKAKQLSFGLTITEDGDFIMDFRGQKMDYAKSTKIAHCLPNNTFVAEPVTWKINGTEPKSNHNNLLVFHMLPQESARINSGDESNIRVSPKGPECDELFIKFHTKDYTLLGQKDPLPTTTTTSPLPPTQTRINTSKRTSTSRKKPPQTTTTPKTTTTSDPGSGNFKFVATTTFIVAFFIFVGGIYCLFNVSADYTKSDMQYLFRGELLDIEIALILRLGFFVTSFLALLSGYFKVMVYHMDTYTIYQTPPYIHYLIPISIFIGLLLITSIINCYYNHLKKRNRRRIEERKEEDRREARRQDAYARCARNMARMRMQRKNKYYNQPTSSQNTNSSSVNKNSDLLSLERDSDLLEDDDNTAIEILKTGKSLAGTEEPNEGRAEETDQQKKKSVVHEPAEINWKAAEEAKKKKKIRKSEKKKRFG